RPQGSAGRDADDPEGVVPRGGDTRDDRAVAVDVGPPTRDAAVDTADDVEVGLVGLDAGVEDRDVDVHRAAPVTRSRAALVGRDAANPAGRHLADRADPARVRGAMELFVGHDGGDVRVAAQGVDAVEWNGRAV